MHAIVPPTIGVFIFTSKPTIHVYAEALAAYQNSDWAMYGTLVGDLADILSIENVEKEDSANTQIYDLYGNKVNSTDREKIYIRNGKKVILH